jgi:hypothetical protein
MRRLTILATMCTLALGAALPVATSAQQADALKAAADALGAGTMKTLQFTGSGANFSVGQNFTPNEPWPRVTVKSYTASINYDTGSMRQELVREMGTTMPRGGGAPFTGEQRQIQLVSGNYAWNLVAGAPGAAPPPPAPVPGNAVERMLMLWATPQGFIKAAMMNNATAKKGKGGTDVSFTVGGKYKMTGTINPQNEVARVQTWIDQPIVGDMLVETVYSGYRDFGGVRFPSRIVQSQDGFPTLDLTVSSATANGAVDIAAPENVRNAPPPPPVRVDSAKLADGVF